MALTKKASRRNSDHSQGGERAANPSCGKTTRHAFFSFFSFSPRQSPSLFDTSRSREDFRLPLGALLADDGGRYVHEGIWFIFFPHPLLHSLSLSLLRGHIAGFFYVTCCVSTKAAQIPVCWGKTLIREPPRWQQRP